MATWTTLSDHRPDHVSDEPNYRRATAHRNWLMRLQEAGHLSAPLVFTLVSRPLCLDAAWTLYHEYGSDPARLELALLSRTFRVRIEEFVTAVRWSNGGAIPRKLRDEVRAARSFARYCEQAGTDTPSAGDVRDWLDSAPPGWRRTYAGRVAQLNALGPAATYLRRHGYPHLQEAIDSIDHATLGADYGCWTVMVLVGCGTLRLMLEARDGDRILRFAVGSRSYSHQTFLAATLSIDALKGRFAGPVGALLRKQELDGEALRRLRVRFKHNYAQLNESIQAQSFVVLAEVYATHARSATMDKVEAPQAAAITAARSLAEYLNARGCPTPSADAVLAWARSFATKKLSSEAARAKKCSQLGPFAAFLRERGDHRLSDALAAATRVKA